MSVDKLTKSLLAAVAVALWVIALNPWLQPPPVAAQSKTDLTGIELDLSSIQLSIESRLPDMGRDLRNISKGDCDNIKICGK